MNSSRRPRRINLGQVFTVFMNGVPMMWLIGRIGRSSMRKIHLSFLSESWALLCLFQFSTGFCAVYWCNPLAAVQNQIRCDETRTMIVNVSVFFLSLVCLYSIRLVEKDHHLQTSETTRQQIDADRIRAWMRKSMGLTYLCPVHNKPCLMSEKTCQCLCWPGCRL
jgi:hypothetical protein